MAFAETQLCGTHTEGSECPGLEFQSEMLASFAGLTQLSQFRPASPRHRPDAAIRPHEPPSLASSTTAPVRAVTMAVAIDTTVQEGGGAGAGGGGGGAAPAPAESRLAEGTARGAALGCRGIGRRRCEWRPPPSRRGHRWGG